MARQRMIKPEFFSSETVTECSFAARLCFIGLWCCADDSGHLRFAPKGLRKNIFGLDDVSLDEFFGYLIELEKVGCIAFYTDGEGVFIDVVNFNVYQTVKNPSKTNIPAPKQGQKVSFGDGYRRTTEGLTPEGVRTNPKELIKQVINSKARGGLADAPPAPSGFEAASYMDQFRRRDDEQLEELPVLQR